MLWHPNGEFLIYCGIFFNYVSVYYIVLGNRLFVDGFQSGLISGNPFSAVVSPWYRFSCTVVVFSAIVAAAGPLVCRAARPKVLAVCAVMCPHRGLGHIATLFIRIVGILSLVMIGDWVIPGASPACICRPSCDQMPCYPCLSYIVVPPIIIATLVLSPIGTLLLD